MIVLHAASTLPSSSQVAPYRASTPSTADLFGLGVVWILMILVSRQLAMGIYRQFRLHRIAVSLQQRATLERQLHCKSSAQSLLRNDLARSL